MGVLESLSSYDKLLNTEYLIKIGRKGKASVLCLVFDKVDWFHTMGLHYLAGCTFSLVIGIMMLFMTHIPVAIFSGLHGLDAPWYMVMPFSVMSVKAWQMLLLHTVVYILGCILTGLLVMMLSLLFDKSMAAAGTVFALILGDLFGSVPTHMRVLSQIRYLTPIFVLLNSNVPDMRLTKLFGTYLISFQTGSLLYLLCGLLLVIVTVRIFRRRYYWKNDSGS